MSPLPRLKARSEARSRARGSRPVDDSFRALLRLGDPIVVLVAAASYAPPQGAALDVLRALLVASLLVYTPAPLAKLTDRPLLSRALSGLALAGLPASAPGWLLTLLAATFAFARSRAALHRWAIVACALPVAMGALLLQLCPSLASLVLAPAATLFSLTAALFLQRRAARAGVRPGALHPPPPGEGARRIAEGWPLGLALSALALLLFSRGTRIVELITAPPEPPAQQARARSAPKPEDEPSEEERRAERRANAPRRNDDGFDPTIGFGGGVFAYSNEEVLRLRPLGKGPAPTAVYLRGVVLDSFGPDGAAPSSRRAPPIWTDEGDGVADGWTRLTDGPVDPNLRFAVDSRRLDLDGGTWSPLFAAEPLAGIELPEVAYDPDQGLFLPQAADERVRYSFDQVPHDWSRRRLANAALRHPSPQNVQLPGAGDLPPGLDGFLEAALPAPRGGLDTVLSIVGYLRTNFTYERLETGFEGLAALGPFLEEQRGFCTHFSTLATLALRARGLPARVVTGFVAHEWDADNAEFIVRDRNAHAWIEVHFEGVGWVAFDPTPAQEGRPELAGGLTYDRPAQELRDALRSWLGGDPDGSLAGVLDAGARAGWAWAVAHVAWVLAALLLAWAAVLGLRRRGSRLERSSQRGSAPQDPPPSGAVRRILRALERAGHRRVRGQTLLQLARSAAARNPELACAEDAAQLHYAERFGSAAPQDPRLDSALRSLEEAAEAERHSAPTPPA